jgi:hypothetical protein
MAQIKINVRGISLNVDPEALDDMELLEDLAGLDEGNALSFTHIGPRLFGKEQNKKIYDVIRSENGRVKASEYGAFLADALTAIKDANEQAKN